jgi:hypothetical protein
MSTDVILRNRRMLEHQLSIVLRYGTWLACAVIASGIGWSLLAEAPGTPAAATAPTRLVAIGIAMLLALPVVRVMLMAVAFARERDYLFVGLASLVLAVIGFGLLLGSR